MANYKYIASNGVIVPDTGETLEQVRDEFRNAFGQDLDVSDETPQGVLITAETLARQAMIENNAALANQINPNQAGGIFLDAIWALTGGARVKATPSIIRDCVLTGRPSTIIPAGSLARCGADGAIFKLVSAVIIGNDGTITGTFQSVDLGAITAPKNALQTIVTGVLGWETVNNPNAAELGRTEESDMAARARRRVTLGLQGVALPEAIISGLYDVEGVKSLKFLENTTNENMTVESVTLTPHSIYVCIDGGTDNDVAWALLQKKSLGCGWNGKVSVDVVEPLSGQAYRVKFDRPKSINIYAKVFIRSTSAISDPALVVREAILQYANGDMEGEQGFIVGNSVSPFELAGAINRNYPTLFVSNLLLSTDGSNYSTNEVKIKVDEKAVIANGSIQVNIGEVNVT